MIQSENLIKLIKNDTQSNLNFYKNLVQESQLDSKEIVETASRIRKAFDLENTKSKNQENPKFSFFSYKALKTQKNFTNVENTSYHTETKITPKIQIFNQRYIPKIEYLTKKSHQNVNNFNLFNNDNMIFNPSSNSFSSETTAIDKDSSKKVEQRTKIIRNDIDYDNKIKPLFFMNRYVEYSYQDKGDYLYENGDLFRHLFEKKIKKDKNQDLFIAKQDTIYLDTYKKLLKQMKEEKNEIAANPLSDSSSREDGKLASDELKNINRYKAYKNELNQKLNISGIGQEKNLNKFDYKSYFLTKITTHENNSSSPGVNNNESLGELNNDKEIVSLGKNVSEVSFNIDVEAEILKNGKRKNKKDIKRKIRINGPIVNIFKPQNSNEELKIMEDKSYFDLRYIKLEDNEEELNNQINNYNRYKKTGNEYTKKISEEVNLINQPQIIYRQKFSINKIKKDEKEIKKPIIFYSNKIEEFQNKSLASLLIELQNYYKEFLFNVENASYKSLKFLSNPNCQIFELHPLECQKLLNNLYWHPKVQILSIPTSFIASLKIVMDARNWECNITTLTVIQDMGVSSPTFEESIFNLFSGINSIPIQNIHFIDVPYNKKIANALFKHIEVFYSITNDILNTIFASKPNSKRFSSNSSEKDFISNEEIDKIDNPKTKFFMSLQKTKLPIINLSWKKTPNSKLSKTNFEEAVDLRGIYYILMDMLIKAYKFNNHKLPEVFNKLDISETTVTDDVVFLVKIITQFKIIKELDISNTKLFSSGKVINSDNFLKKIKLTNDIDGIFNSEEEAKFMDETMKEISFFKYCTEQERNNLPINLKDEQVCYNYFMGIFPILEKLYVYNTDIKESVARDIYVLFKKLKFFQGFYCSSSTNNNILLTTINSLANIIQSDSSSFCENVFKINN
jgi:hypothetical protein